jgi:DNA-binding transcriptional MocR family regulator
VSIRAFRWAKREVREHPQLNTSACFVLIMRSWPSQQTLAEEVGADTKTVSRAISSLREAGLVVTEKWVIYDSEARLPYRYCLPRYDRKSLPARVQPVQAHGPSSDFLDRDNSRQIPGSRLWVDAEALAP